uniref:hypothetical protein n=1 Tax=Alistipes sp. TaxID=1872444 RepID=UPI004055AB23
MKKYAMTLGLMLGMLSLTGCQKDIDNSTNIEGAEQQITRTITVEGEWEGDTRSEYVEGEGVQLTGKEVLTVYYGDAQYTANDTADASKLAKTKAEPSGEGDFLYTFSHSAIDGAAAYDYYFIMPNTTTNNMQSKGHRPMVYLNTIQAPKANTFDAAQDYLVGQPLLNQSEAATSSTVRFKRMFAPLRMMVKNGGALLEGEKILYATISQSATCTAKNPLVGSVYFRFSPGNDNPEKSDAYEDARIRNFLSTGYGNKVTAFYPTGLEIAGEGYPVWYIINPSNTDNDTPTTISGDMTVTLVTDQRMLSRTVTLANPMEFAANKLNQFSITFGDDADVVAGEAVTTTFANYSSLSDLEGWEFEHCSYNNKSVEIANSETNAGKITLPTPAGKKITKIIVLPSLYHPNNSTLNNLELHAGDATIESYNFNTQNMLTSTENMYGYLVIDVPVEYQAAQLALVKPTTDKAKSSIRAITLIYEDSTAPAASVKFVSADLEELTFNVEMVNAEKYYYFCQPSSEEAPTAEEVVSNGTEATDTNLTITGLNEATAYTLYVVAVKGDTKSSVASAEGKTKNSATDYYELYKAGNDITINGITYKAGDYTPILGDATTADYNFHNDLNKKTSKIILFLDTDGEHIATIANNTNIFADIVITSRYSNKKATLKPGTYMKLSATNSGAGLSLLNLNIDLSSITNDYFLSNSGATADIEHLVVKGCDIAITQNRFYQANSNAYGCIIKNITFENNVYRATYASATKAFLIDAKNCPRQADFERLTVKNNLFYNSNQQTAGLCILNYANGTAQTSSEQKLVIVCQNNTFVDLVGRDMYFKLYKISAITIQQNLFYATETGVFFNSSNAPVNSLTYRTYAVSEIEGATSNKTLATDVCASCSISDNIHYGFNGWNYYDSSSTYNQGGQNTQPKLSESPFTTFDPANGVFDVSTAYMTYGYQTSYSY